MTRQHGQSQKKTMFPPRSSDEEAKTRALRVCYFGTFDPSYPRNAINIKGLKRMGVEVVTCQRQVWGSWDKAQTTLTTRVLAGLRLLSAYLTLPWAYLLALRHDVVLVGYMGQFDMPLAWLLTRLRRTPLVLDAFLSLYETAVEDRALVPARSLRAKVLRLVDRLACTLADKVLLDTNAHIDYFVRKLNLHRNKFARVLIGADEDYFHPLTPKKPDGRCRVLFFGHFIPLHGAETIVRAAHLLAQREDILFKLIGRGQTYDEARSLAEKLGVNNIRWVDHVAYHDLVKHIGQADICLGIFGTSAKTARVIPHKVFQALSCARPVITAASPAIEEIQSLGAPIHTVPPDDPEALAEAITDISNATDNFRSCDTMSWSVTSHIVGRQLVAVLERVTAEA